MFFDLYKNQELLTQKYIMTYKGNYSIHGKVNNKIRKKISFSNSSNTSIESNYLNTKLLNELNVNIN